MALAVSFKKKPKYGNRKVVTKDGEVIDSKKEAKRLRELKLLERAGVITDLQTQVKFELIPPQIRSDGTAERACAYVADFVYHQDGQRIVEDVKSCITAERPDYIIKRKLMLFVHGVTIREHQ